MDGALDKHFEWCAYPSCKAKTETHHWAKIKANEQGWFFEREGPIWCPKHNPPWVAEWRASKATQGA